MGAVAYKVYYGIGKNSELNWETFYGGRVGGGGGGRKYWPSFLRGFGKKRSDFFIKTVSYYNPKQQRSNLDVTFYLIIETFRFEGENSFEYEISLEVFSRLPKI